jgi:hypothetical protein
MPKTASGASVTSPNPASLRVVHTKIVQLLGSYNFLNSIANLARLNRPNLCKGLLRRGGQQRYTFFDSPLSDTQLDTIDVQQVFQSSTAANKVSSALRLWIMDYLAASVTVFSHSESASLRQIAVPGENEVSKTFRSAR